MFQGTVIKWYLKISYLRVMYTQRIHKYQQQLCMTVMLPRVIIEMIEMMYNRKKVSVELQQYTKRIYTSLLCAAKILISKFTMLTMPQLIIYLCSVFTYTSIISCRYLVTRRIKKTQYSISSVCITC